MMKQIKDLFKIEPKPSKNLFAFEWVVMAYLALTLLVILFCFTKVQNPEAMIWGRVRVLALTAATYAVYRMVPCKFTRLVRVGVQMGLLSWWYPDTYELNRMFPNLDHLFAQWEQNLFGFQPALLFSQAMPGALFSELMDLGYASYYPMIAAVTLFYFFCRYNEFQRAAFIILGAFFIFYVVFVFVPVVGPTFYFHAVGVEEIAKGIFPNLHDYFNAHTECLPSPGYADGIFYQLVEDAKAAGERPTAAFPSSHVGVTTVLMFLAWHSHNRRLFYIMLPLFVLMFFATVYIQAHYAIDALAGLASGTLIHFLLFFLSQKMVRP